MIFLSQIAALALLANAEPVAVGQRPAVIYHVQLVKPIPYVHLDWSRTTNPQYNIMMNNLEGMTPKQAALEYIANNIKKRLDAYEAEYKPQEASTGLTDAGKLSVTVFAALMASAVILRYLLRRKPR